MADYRQQQVLQEEEEYIEMERIAALKKLRVPFEPRSISKLPKPTKAQTDALKSDPKAGIRCEICDGWHHPKVIHLDYVGHAALTDRLLDVDPLWSWEPLALDEGIPKFDKTGGLWIKLTICGVTRLGYGHAADASYKEIGSREKEVIGDALRNAAMRFGAALDLWHKGVLHPEDEKPSLKHTPNDGAGDNLSSDKKNLIADTATAIKDAYEANDADAIHNLYRHVRDNDEHLYLWSLLDSKIRSTITAYKAIVNADDLDELKKAWDATPKHAHAILAGVKNALKNELTANELATGEQNGI